MLRMTDFCAGDPIKPDRVLEDRRMGVSIVIIPVTFQQIVPKLSQLETAKRSSAKSNYVLIAPVTDTELKAVEAADVTTVNASNTHRFVTRKTTQGSEDFWLHKTREQARSFILLLWSRIMESNAVHSLTVEQAVRMRSLPFWTIS